MNNSNINKICPELHKTFYVNNIFLFKIDEIMVKFMVSNKIVPDPTDLDFMALELKDRVTVFNRKSPSIKRTPVIYISSQSPSMEVQDWLKQKDFNDQ